MNMKAKMSLVLATVILSVGMMAGCTQEQKQAESVQALYTANAKEAPVMADPEAAIDDIYASLSEYDAVQMSDRQLEAYTGIDKDAAIEVYGMRSDPKSTLADVIIVKPLPGVREDVRNMLSQYKQERIAEFENFDILDAYSISKSAVIYDQGEYLVMLMLEDNISAQGIVDEYIPQ